MAHSSSIVDLYTAGFSSALPLTFFTTPELLEISDIPFPSPNQKPTRNEALEYYRKVAEHYQLDIRQYETVGSITGSDGAFTVHTTDRFGRSHEHSARKLVIATGYYDLPNCFLLPHIGSATIETRNAMGFRALDNLDAFFAGRPAPDALT